MRIRWTVSAQKDFYDLVDYLCSEDVTAAEKFVNRVERMQDHLTSFPQIGSPLESALPMRQILVKPARLLYFEEEHSLTIIACVHQSRDWASLLEARELR